MSLNKYQHTVLNVSGNSQTFCVLTNPSGGFHCGSFSCKKRQKTDFFIMAYEIKVMLNNNGSSFQFILLSSTLKIVCPAMDSCALILMYKCMHAPLL